ncbi:MAG: hypothetical protein ACFCUE_04480 [Candidatus Bathyarchaeia archaeon]|jgi:hypothetical protein
MFETLKDRAWIIPFLLLVLSGFMWLISSFQARATLSVNINALNELGLFSILSFSFFIAFALLIFSFFVTLMIVKKYQIVFLILHTLLLVFFLNFTPSIVEGTARFATSYSNFQAVNYISQFEHINPSVLWILNWPSFSILVSIFSQVTCFSPSTILLFYPTVFNLLFVAVLVLFFSTLFNDNKLVWLAVWFISLGNWVGQDYFSMQSMGLFFVVLLLFLLTSNMHKKLKNRAWTVPFLLSYFFVVSSHLLSSIVVISTLFVLVISGFFRRSVLLLSSAVLLISWTIYGAINYLNGSLVSNLQSFMNLSTIFLTNFTNRASVGSAAHILVTNIRLVYSGLFILIAIFSVVVLIATGNFKRNEKMVFAILIGFSIPVIFAYGGEIFMRLYMFLLIPSAYLVAKAFLAHKRLFLLGLLFFTILTPPLVMISRYGNEQMDYTPNSQLRGADFFFGSTTNGLVYGSFNYVNYPADYRKFSLPLMPDSQWNPPTIGIMKQDFICVSHLSVQSYSTIKGQEDLLGSLYYNLSHSPFTNKVYSNPSFDAYHAKYR